ncbi:hypothetical protein BKA69DRAFT_748743 [Paraphysoderma sedebokerense]|nr:hypothetical protein BKA69DRAFT_748743 [Paraphysoderma sedebokerense]
MNDDWCLVCDKATSGSVWCSVLCQRVDISRSIQNLPSCNGGSSASASNLSFPPLRSTYFVPTSSIFNYSSSPSSNSCHSESSSANSSPNTSPTLFPSNIPSAIPSSLLLEPSDNNSAKMNSSSYQSIPYHFQHPTSGIPSAHSDSVEENTRQNGFYSHKSSSKRSRSRGTAKFFI